MTKILSKAVLLVAAIAIIGGGAALYYKLDFLAALLQKNQIPETNTPKNNISGNLGAAITYIDGAVEFKPSGREWQRADIDTNLNEGDSVEIVGSGRAIITFDDGSAIRLNSNSGATLSSLDPQNILITNDKGQIYARVVKAERTFAVSADTVRYESLGTAYRTVNTENENGVEVYQSQVKVIKEKKEIVTVEEGQSYYDKLALKPTEEKKVKEISKTEIIKDDFVQWNQEKDLANDEYKAAMGILAAAETAENEAADNEQDNSSGDSAGEIKLTAAAVAKGVKLTWTIGGINVSQGFKIVKSTATNPVYPGNDYQYLTAQSARSYTWNLTDGKTYYFRVCQYLGGKCGVYSNNVKVTAPQASAEETPSGEVTAIALTAGSNGVVSWKTSGYSESGFKVVWSKNAGPTYPCRSGDQYQYYSEPGKSSATLTAFAGSGTYHVRVCEYLGGKCGRYSNEITISLTGESENSEEADNVSSISLSGSGQAVAWTVSGYAEQGYKLVWSKNAGPTYPCREGDQYQYFSNPATKSGTLSAFAGSGTYYVRVCEYLGGQCGVYSNQISVTLNE